MEIKAAQISEVDPVLADNHNAPMELSRGNRAFASLGRHDTLAKVVLPVAMCLYGLATGWLLQFEPLLRSITENNVGWIDVALGWFHDFSVTRYSESGTNQFNNDLTKERVINSCCV